MQMHMHMQMQMPMPMPMPMLLHPNMDHGPMVGYGVGAEAAVQQVSRRIVAAVLHFCCAAESYLNDMHMQLLLRRVALSGSCKLRTETSTDSLSSAIFLVMGMGLFHWHCLCHCLCLCQQL